MTGKQLKWDYMFWLMLGNANLYISSRIPSLDVRMYFLDNSKIEFPEKMTDKADKLFLSKSRSRDYYNSSIKYKYDNGSEETLNYQNIVHYSDLTPTTNAWFKSSSVVDALYKVLSNSELTLDAKNINLHFSKKFMVSGSNDFEDVNKEMMSPQDKQQIERKTMSSKAIQAVQAPVNIQRYVDDLAKLKLDESFISDLYSIGRIYNIPKDIIEASLNNGSTYENQEKSTGRHVDYTLKPKGDDFVEGIKNYFGYDDNLEMSWDHLPFQYYRQLEKAKMKTENANAFEKLVRAGITVEEAKQMIYEN